MDPILPSAPVIAALLLLLWRYLSQRIKTASETCMTAKETAAQCDPYATIEPLSNFEWRATPPLKIRPFKAKYHLTMALENCPLSELIENDDTYLERILLRQDLMDAHPRETYRCNPVCEPAVRELYEWMFGTYLPRRFPGMYQRCQSRLDDDGEKEGGCLYNIAAQRTIPLQAPSSGAEALYTLGANVDTDMLLLLPSSTSPVDGSPIYHLQAFVTCFPSGFATQEKLGLPLSGIHKPVPGYAAKLEKSMDRFFAKLECGKAVRRCNWSITTNDGVLFTQGGNHMYEDGGTGEEGSRSVEEQREEVQIGKCRLRCERQTLHRLPGTKALVFMFKTYQYRLEDVKAEGKEMAEALAEAIPGLAGGSVPEMAFYKRQVVWGDKVVEYLRS